MKQNNIFIIIIIIILLILLFISVIKFQNYENFENETIVSNLSKKAGFYSELFFLFNHYLYCKRNKINFKINSENWLFKYKDGWTDYFEPIELVFYENNSNYIDKYHMNILYDFKVVEYKEAIIDVYKYNNFTKAILEKSKEELNLKDKQYSSIFIRRGDKLAYESKLINEDEYIKILLNKNPQCNHLYVQTDDYNCIINLQKYIDNNNINIKLYTLCPNDQYGTVVLNKQKDELININQNRHNENKEYISNNVNKMITNTSVQDMNQDEIKKHTLDMIIGVDIVSNSDYCILDYQSNVSRFIKLYHKNPVNVIDVLDTYSDIDYNKTIIPAESFFPAESF